LVGVAIIHSLFNKFLLLFYSFLVSVCPRVCPQAPPSRSRSRSPARSIRSRVPMPAHCCICHLLRTSHIRRSTHPNPTKPSAPECERTAASFAIARSASQVPSIHAFPNCCICHQHQKPSSHRSAYPNSMKPSALECQCMAASFSPARSASQLQGRDWCYQIDYDMYCNTCSCFHMAGPLVLYLNV
jgi:hypothetical protein